MNNKEKAIVIASIGAFTQDYPKAHSRLQELVDLEGEEFKGDLLELVESEFDEIDDDDVLFAEIGFGILKRIVLEYRLSKLF